MLYTANTAVAELNMEKMTVYILLDNKGNDAVVPDKTDLTLYKTQILTWLGVKSNYLTKLMRKEAIEWMSQVSKEAITEDVVLVDEQLDFHHSFRAILTDTMLNMFSSNGKLSYGGDLHH